MSWYNPPGQQNVQQYGHMYGHGAPTPLQQQHQQWTGKQGPPTAPPPGASMLCALGSIPAAPRMRYIPLPDIYVSAEDKALDEEMHGLNYPSAPLHPKGTTQGHAYPMHQESSPTFRENIESKFRRCRRISLDLQNRQHSISSRSAIEILQEVRSKLPQATRMVHTAMASLYAGNRSITQGPELFRRAAYLNLCDAFMEVSIPPFTIHIPSDRSIDNMCTYST